MDSQLTFSKDNAFHIKCTVLRPMQSPRYTVKEGSNPSLGQITFNRQELPLTLQRAMDLAKDLGNKLHLTLRKHGFSLHKAMLMQSH